jgi:hypothetical protein
MPLFGTLVTLTRYCTTEAQYEVAEVGELFIVQGVEQIHILLCVQRKPPNWNSVVTVVTRLRAGKQA